MATTLPVKLRIPSIQPFATRSAQLSKILPIIAYWCDYHVVNQILAKGLHSADDECRDFTTELMDKLESAKNQSPPVDAIVDDIAARAYVEQFALETFQRGDTAIHTDKASRQTIDTFQAACTFIELLANWEPLSAELQAKIKYAKYHALRIAKAIKAGEDPNATNPKDDIPAPIATPGLGHHEDAAAAPSTGTAYQPPSVESVPDSGIPSPTRTALDIPSTSADTDVPAISAMDQTLDKSETNDQSTGEYFPQVPITTTAAAPLTGANMPPSKTARSSLPMDITPGSIGQDPSAFYTQPALPTPSPIVPPPAPNPTKATPAPPPPAARPSAPTRYIDDDESVAKAQKHARWAISALNFEDVPTAVKELRLALQTLGAT